MNVESLANSLAGAGLNLFAVLDRGAIGRSPALANSSVQKWSTTILIGNSGPQMWQQIPAEYLSHEHPVDQYAHDTVGDLLTAHLLGTQWQVLCPEISQNVECPPLQLLGGVAGWHHPSPLGIGINNVSGLWFAYRAVVGVQAELPSTGVINTESPCLSCREQSCVKACPASAIEHGTMPDMKKCATHRIQPGSLCADRCLARQACPVSSDKKYSDQQMAHHYLRSLPAIKNWLATMPDSTGRN